ncbi:MAG: hypothetical protein GX620_06185 [Chloroflexi bacterium]|nr:hypothetical protein [Chloroflexota bacterium]
MNRTGAIVVLVLSVILLTVGLLFLCAATRDSARFPLALVLLAAGGAGVVWSALSLRRLRDLSPENLSDRITELAKAGGNGEVTLSEVVAQLGVPDDAAVAALNLLERQGQAHRDRVGERDVYVFPGLKPVLVRRRCPYCGSEFSVKTAVYKCPHCGGDLTLKRE